METQLLAENLKISIGRRHRQAREQVLSMSVSDYAQQMRVRDVTVYAWESGRSFVPQEVIAELESQFGISASWILNGTLPILSAHRKVRLALQQSGETDRLVDSIDERIAQIASLTQRIRAVQPAPPVRIPILSYRVSAGLPYEVDDAMEASVDMNSLLVRDAATTYAVRVNGDSMINAGIEEGDLLIVNTAHRPKHGQIVIAKVDGSLTVKRYLLQDGTVVLAAENPRYPDIRPGDDTSLDIVAVVEHCIKSL